MFKILVVDDDMNLRNVIKFNLVASGYFVTTAENDEAGLKSAQSRKPDLIVLDVKMPGMSGWDVLTNLRSTPKLKRVPVLIATAYLSPSDEERTSEVGVSYLAKPFNISELLAQVKKALGE
jgi:two-component system alkaline phosphatase synthesis response regulator PhoP